MKPETITDKIFAKSDRDLLEKLEACTKWVWDETGHNASIQRPTDCEWLNKVMSGTGIPLFKEYPWIGAIQKFHTEVAFAYLRDKYREQAIQEFMSKVESIETILNELTL